MRVRVRGFAVGHGCPSLGAACSLSLIGPVLVVLETGIGVMVPFSDPPQISGVFCVGSLVQGVGGVCVNLRSSSLPKKSYEGSFSLR